MNLTPQHALLELTLEDAEAASARFEDVVVQGLARGLPAEVLTRLEEIWSQTKVIAGHVIAIGKVIVRRILDFLKANPHLAVGAALGAAVAFIAASSLPFVGAMLAPLAAVIGAVYGMGIAAAWKQGDATADPLNVAIALAKEFLGLFVAVLDAVSDYLRDEFGAADVPA
jgi:C4-dicarboxylate transporter